jgi:DNA repair protein RAD50
MSHIDKLSILGVRSFDNVRSETIQFSHPLTLIVGLNGSGKTTIIECLKNATTGEYPANTKGGAFVHDPKLCGEKEVLAQVKVAFHSTDNTRMVCTRNMQLTVKKATSAFKTLEGSLLMIRGGERLTLSSRVAEMNTMMPQYLGVSKAILDSVIFCHQEESLWPLSAPADLKKRFDEIFEALKYTKAIENIKILQKQKREALIGFQKDEERCRIDKDRGEQKQKQMEKLHADIDVLRYRADEKKAEMDEAGAKSDEASKKCNDINMIVSNLQGKRIIRDAKQESVHSLRGHITEMSDSDEDLQRMLDQYEERVEKYQDELSMKKEKYGELKGQIDQMRIKVSAKERECGSYEAQKETHDRQKQNRETLVKETARSHGIRGYDLDVDDRQAKEFMDRISKMARDQNAAFERARRETQEELQRAQKVLNEINEQKSAMNSRKDNAKQTISTYDRKVEGFRNNLNNINVDEGAIATLRSQESETDARLASAKADRQDSDINSTIEDFEQQLHKLDEHKEKLDAELADATRHAGDSAQLDFVRKELKARQESLETMKAAHGAKIAALVGDEWTPSNVESDFDRVVKQRSENVNDAEKQLEGSNRELSQLNFKFKTCTDDLQKKHEGLKATQVAIRNVADCEPEEYPSVMDQLQREREFAKSDSDSFSKVVEYFDSCLKSANEHNGCKTCTRSFANAKELEKMIKNVEKEKKKFESSNEVKEELAAIEKDLKAAKGVSSEYDSWERIKNKEIPALERDAEDLKGKRERLLTQLEEQDSVVRERQMAKKDVEAMSKTVQTIANYNNEISGFQKQIQELVAKQKSAGLSRGLEIIQEDTKKVNEQAKITKTRLAEANSDRNRAEKTINTLEIESRDIKSKLSAANYQLQEKRSLERQIEEYKTLSNEQRESIKSIDKELQGLGPKLSHTQARYDDIARQGADRDRELQAEYNKLNNSVNKLQTADQDIQSYIDRDGDGQLRNAKRNADSLREEVSHLEREQSQVVRDVRDLEKQLSDHSDTKRGIEDNQKFRRDLRALNVVTKEIEDLEKHNAEKEKANYEKEANHWHMQRNKFSAEHASLVGSLKSKDEQLSELIAEFDAEYKGAPRSYKQAHIRCETTRACVDDLGRYSNALDKAIMKYHSLKMEEINRIIEELWRKTYQGTDVDTIMIKSENEHVKSNKSYNYRVVMVKQDAEMDMRGRCSAGQKVLASIIIRLALAECFGTNCGLIALDEPTTNLDRDNIIALARSLAEIIKVRKAQKNFQLIVITHDEEFLREMQCSEYADVYYRVSRNEKQKSIIERQNIGEVM